MRVDLPRGRSIRKVGGGGGGRNGWERERMRKERKGICKDRK